MRYRRKLLWLRSWRGAQSFGLFQVDSRLHLVQQWLIHGDAVVCKVLSQCKKEHRSVKAQAFKGRAIIRTPFGCITRHPRGRA